ncbi:septal ring lytic transglycosylase RlpA family protein [Hydrogenophaga sp. RWCD_12]|uniref:septal ring lytic transglycosylase RlpA family protein n=1 Tax=Hydrogenophaga sp. RWCD_12 TaxID=3391190 RepID=UPI003984B649
MNNIARRLACMALLAGLAACATAPAPSLTPASAPRSAPTQASVAVPSAPAARSEVAAKPVEPAAAVPNNPSDTHASSASFGEASSAAVDGLVDRGVASWYGRKFHGRRTASGERYDMNAMTAAHKTLPFGTKVRVRAVATGKEVVVRINDRGPYRHQRIIDLSQAAIASLGLKNRGVTTVELLRE